MDWQPTPALGRAVVVGAVGLALGVLLGSPAVVLLAAPLVLHACAALLHRPDPAAPAPRLSATLDQRSLYEGQGTRSRLQVEPGGGVEHVTRAMRPTPYVAFDPPSGVVGGVVGGVLGGPLGGPVTGPVLTLGPRRWGRRVLGGETVALSTSWAGYRFGPVDLDGVPVRVLADVPAFRSRAQAPRPLGLVGAHRSPRLGAGTEFADIRLFRAGDRLRRISWRVSSRTGELHVTTSPAERDTGVLLVVDALGDHGRSGGLDGDASSLDRAVRAASALATHHVHTGDRVALRVVGGDGGLVDHGSGGRHLRMLQDTLAGIRPGGLPEGIVRRLRLQVRGGSLVFVLSPLLDAAIVAATAGLARRGLPVVVVDTLPVDARPDVPPDVDTRLADLAWRMRRLEREQVLGALTALGCPVVPWAGSGTVDAVLVRLGRQAGRPTGMR